MRFARFIGLALVALVLAVLVFVALRPPPSGPSERAGTRERAGTGERHEHAPPASTAIPAQHDDAGRVARARWEHRRASIRAAHARLADRGSPTVDAPTPGCADGDCGTTGAEGDDGDWFAAFHDETTTLVQGCEHLLGERPKPVRVRVHLIGSPDVGTIVERVDVSGPADHRDELAECLAEGMYTLALGEPRADFERDAVLGLGLLDEVAREGWLTPEQLEATRQQMIAGGLDPATDPMVYSDGDPPPPP